MNENHKTTQFCLNDFLFHTNVFAIDALQVWVVTNLHNIYTVTSVYCFVDYLLITGNYLFLLLLLRSGFGIVMISLSLDSIVSLSESLHWYIGIKKCREDRCGMCEHLLTGISIKLKNRKVWTIKSNMNCKAKSVTYIFVCILCKSFYVGQTQNLRKRE